MNLPDQQKQMICECGHSLERHTNSPDGLLCLDCIREYGTDNNNHNQFHPFVLKQSKKKVPEVKIQSFIEWYGSCDIQYNARYGVGNMHTAYKAGQRSMQPQLTHLQDTIANLRLQLKEKTGYEF